MTDEWSNWIEHDGKTCPVEGYYVQTQRFSGEILENIAGSASRQAGRDPNKIGSAWIWYTGFKFSNHIKSYRIRKPKGMQVIDEILEFFSINEKISEDS